MRRTELARSLSSRFPSLTARECDILACVGAGMSNADIGATLGVTERTVKNTLLPVPFKVGAGEDRGGSIRVRLALIVHGIVVED